MSNYKNLDIKAKYDTDTDNLPEDFFNMVLPVTKIYNRSAGFFSSSVFVSVAKGIAELYINGGKINLLIGHILSEKDVDAMEKGLSKDSVLKDSILSNFTPNDFYSDDGLNILSWLIYENRLEIKLVISKDKPKDFLYHLKTCVLMDYDDNMISFNGSSNASISGLVTNKEVIEVDTSDTNMFRCNDRLESFEKTWNGLDSNWETIELPKAIKDELISKRKPLDENELIKKAKERNKWSKLRDYQKDAVNAWINNDYNGFFVMATGTGKTYTSAFCIREYIEKFKSNVAIVVPYIHLVRQWEETLKNVLDDVDIITCSSAAEDNKWDVRLISKLLTKNKEKNVVLISVNDSFLGDRMTPVLKYFGNNRLLVVDEAHNFYNQLENPRMCFEHRLGLSATPVFGNDEDKTKKLLDFFGGSVYELPIEKALGKFLVNYNYHPIFVESNSDEEEKFKYYTRQMQGCVNPITGGIKNQDKFTKAWLARLRVIATVSEKMNKLGDIISNINFDDHFIIYCSDGKTFEHGDETYLKKVSDKLNEIGFKPSKFTCNETAEDRRNIIKNFHEGYINSILAIRCLDEGIDIPSIKAALILASKDNYREFVQRRGRILRLCKEKGKDINSVADIYDIVVLPSNDCPGIAKIEFRRFYEYARLAKNVKNDNLIETLKSYLDGYGLTMDDIKFDNMYIEGGMEE